MNVDLDLINSIEEIKNDIIEIKTFLTSIFRINRENRQGRTPLTTESEQSRSKKIEKSN